MPADYPKWRHGETPGTNRSAVPCRWRSVTDVPAIRVEGAHYRSCQPIDGVFELVSGDTERVNGEDRYEVYCSWFGVKPVTKYPRIFVPKGERLEHYSGEVIDDISA